MTNTAQTAVLTPHSTLYLGVLLEQSEYDIALPHTQYSLSQNEYSGCVVRIDQQHLKIRTDKVFSILQQDLMLLENEFIQKISFYIVPNIFDLSCQTE